MPNEEPALTYEQAKRKMLQLQALAPGISFARNAIVRDRFTRASQERSAIEREFVAAMHIRLAQYDRERSVHEIDRQWLALSRQIPALRLASQRQRQGYYLVCVHIIHTLFDQARGAPGAPPSGAPPVFETTA